MILVDAIPNELVGFEDRILTRRQLRWYSTVSNANVFFPEENTGFFDQVNGPFPEHNVLVRRRQLMLFNRLYRDSRLEVPFLKRYFLHRLVVQDGYPWLSTLYTKSQTPNHTPGSFFVQELGVPSVTIPNVSARTFKRADDIEISRKLITLSVNQGLVSLYHYDLLS